MNNILDFSKIESGDVELNESPFDLKASINEVVDKMRSLAQIKGLELIINYPPSMLRGFIGDQKRLHQALENLVENAIKFTEHGHIVIEAKASKPRNDVSFITICVRDTGIGIAENKVDSIFQEFTQADSTSKRTHGGTGLGLSIARAIIEMMDGRITVDSQLGHGSSFKLNFPLSIDPNTDRRKYDRDALKGKRILIIDDLETNRHVLSEQLAYWTVDTKSVPNSERALAALNVAQAQNQPFDLILLDDLMPDMSGKRLAEEISKNNELNCIPIIMLSASNVTVCEETLSQLNIKFSLTKPVKAQILYDKISSVLTTGVKAESTKALDIDDTIDLNKNLIETRSPIDAPIEILIAEDLKLNQEVINLMFDETIYSPVFADNGQIALELYTTNPSRFAVILMDISLPVMDGYQTAREIISFNETRRLPHIPIIALTGHALKGDREKCFEIGMNDFLSKPFKRTDLIGKIESWISNSEKLSIIAS